MSATKLMGKRSLVLAATLVLVVSMGLPVIAHGAVHAAPSTVPATTATHAGAGAAATTQNAATVAPRSVISPHPGQLLIHEIVPGGATTEDPSVAYDTVSFEPIINTYETLVAYNGTTTASFVPVLSTCVPGTAGCTADYGTSLIVNGGPTSPLGGALNGQPVYWTFPVDPTAMFYDPNTSASWHVTATDVAFTLARTLSYANLPFVASQNGWISAQSLLPFGNRHYDVQTYGGFTGPMHYPYNNTPFNVMSSMLINNSTYCPAAALTQAGCVTFVADGGGQDWPFFLQIVADALGTGVESCGVFTLNGAGLPGFVASGHAGGDGPCQLPGNVNSTDAAGFQSWLSNPSQGSNDQLWDNAQGQAANAPAINGFTRHDLVGSGPYTAAVSLSSGYTLTYNPGYAEPIGCTGGTFNLLHYYQYTGYCDPAPHSYAHQVIVAYDPNDANSIAGYSAGTIDAGGIFPSHTLTNLIPLKNQGKLQVSTSVSLSNFFFGYDNEWSSAAFATDFPSDPAPNIPSDFFNYEAARQFFTESYPYLNVQNQLLSVGGIQYGFDNVCGPIPFGMGNYYPANNTCPSGNPDSNPSDPGGAAWWWAQGTNPVSPFYDPEMAACISHQCTLPIVGEQGAQTLNAALQQWINQLYTLSGNHIKPYEFDLTFTDLIVEVLFSSAGSNPVPIWNLGWAPDYPDPTDYIQPYALPDSTYTFPDAIAEAFATQDTPANATACTHSTGSATDALYWAYNPAVEQIKTQCEGFAYNASVGAEVQAAPLQDTPQRVLDYNAAQTILTKLSLYVWFEQQNSVGTVAPWIDPSTVNNNPTIGGGADQPFFHWGYAPPNVITFKESKLPIGAHWSVTLGQQYNNTTYQVGSQSAGTVVIHVPNGTQSFIINAPAGFGVAKITGTGNPNQTSGTVTGGVSVTWTVQFGAEQPVTFDYNATHLGLYSGANWEVYLNATLPHGGPASQFASGTGTSLLFYGPAGAAYKFNVVAPTIYRIAPGHGGFAVPATHGLTKLIHFILLTVTVNFHATGLTGVFTWDVNITGASGAAAAWFAATYPHNLNMSKTSAIIVAKLPSGTYTWEASGHVGAKNPTPATGTLTVSYPSGAVTVTIAYA